MKRYKSGGNLDVWRNFILLVADPSFANVEIHVNLFPAIHSQLPSALSSAYVLWWPILQTFGPRSGSDVKSRKHFLDTKY